MAAIGVAAVLKRAPLTAQELAALPVGVQPQEDGMLACLICGSWFRGLAHHVAGKHQISADDYRRQFQLPRRHSLWNTELKAAAAVRARQRQSRPNRSVQTRLSGTAAQVQQALAAQRESQTRAGSKLQAAARYARQAAEHRQRTRQRYEHMAQAVGYTDLDDLMRASHAWPARQLAHVLGISPSGAKWLRRYHRAGFTYEHHPPKPAAYTPGQLAELEPGQQPQQGDHLLCRVCGTWLRGLARHLTTKHDIDTDAYRQRFGLGADGLLSATSKQTYRQQKQRIQEAAARNLGYGSLAELVATTRHQPAAIVAEQLQVTATAVYQWRKTISADDP